eukprot:CAMPEP_0204495764 /NCGR_PEP_ID=MMETSP0471-20130131/87190_1 /ASSEMBLY_ACC=CAM_ASM_000602 /TAXON_ID=2969 /ORGANISM="Oxyrrhis marina" /LENGTH=41 /DNA_ID= /DNA_START= /DNA_END= /DNA_ORIENTATION=
MNSGLRRSHSGGDYGAAGGLQRRAGGGGGPNRGARQSDSMN